MADIMLHTSNNSGFTCISNTFIDDFMKDANGEYVKTYLYLLRCLNKDGYEFSIEQLADCLDHTEKDVMRAFNYWEKVGLLRLEYDSTGELSGIYFEDVQGYDRLASPVISTATSMNHLETHQLNTRPIETPQPLSMSMTAPTAVTIEKPNYSPDELQAFRNDSEVEDLLFVTQRYIGKPLSTSDTTTILFWYDSLHMSVDLIQYLIEYCLDNDHRSFHYMDTVARNWADDGITTVEQAKNSSRSHSNTVYSIMKAMGISGRDLIPQEMQYVYKWTDVFGFDLELICEACRRTILATNKPSFKYADTILTGWHNSSVASMDDVKRLDAQFQAAAAARPQAKPRNNASTVTRKPTTNKFTNFPQRDYDFDELERKLLGR